MVLELIDSSAITGSSLWAFLAVFLLSHESLGLVVSLWTWLWSELSCWAVMAHWTVVHPGGTDSNDTVFSSDTVDTIINRASTWVGVLTFVTGDWKLGSSCAIETTWAEHVAIVWKGGSSVAVVTCITSLRPIEFTSLAVVSSWAS